MMRPCHIGPCRATPVMFVAPSPAVAGVVGVGACGTHVTRVMRMIMADYSTQWVRVRLMGEEVASYDGSVSGDHPIGGGT